MSKEDFLQGLQTALSGNVPPAVIQEQLRYYKDYIQTEQQSGRTETDVLEELGDPRLIARTIMDATPGAGEGAYEEYRPYGGYRESSGGSAYQDAGQTSGQENPYQGRSNVYFYNLNKWYWKLLGIFLIIAVVTVVITVVTGLLSLVIPMLPVIGLVILIMWFVRGGGR